MAETHPEINFVAVHMELCGDHSHVMNLIAQHPNLYGDTTFPPVSDVREAIDRCGADKIVLGSDAPILSEQYASKLDELRMILSPMEQLKIFQANAMRLFQMNR